MTLKEKQAIAALARQLIMALHECDDADYIEAVIECVNDGEIYPAIDPAYMRQI